MNTKSVPWRHPLIWKILLTTAIFYLLWQVVAYFKQNEYRALESRITQIQQRLITLENESFKNMDDALADIIFDQETAKIMAQVDNGELNPKTARQWLYQKFEPIYRKLSRRNLRHMQFHLPDGRSFLRVHQPDKFGDSLVDVRPSIRTIIHEHKPLYGFEVGRYLGAFRALYPLFYQGRYVGSAEFSFTFDVMKKALEKIDGSNAIYYLALNFQNIKESAYASQIDVFQKCYVDDRFVIEKSVAKRCALLKQTGFKTSLLPYRTFSKVLEPAPYDNRIVTFVPLQLIDGDHGGYYVIIQKDNGVVATISKIVLVAHWVLFIAWLASIGLITMAHLYRKESKAAGMDPLSGIYNRRGCLKKFVASPTYHSVIFFDIDHFKQINDTHGHDKGDEVIRILSKAIRRHIRKEDLFCRFGGDEFLIFLREDSREDVLKIAKKLHRIITKTEIPGIGYVGISMGAAIRQKDESIDSLIARADRALYRAKEKGRNRVEF
jgi:diguanylate cyclase (GGDEF)-like protein